MDAPRRACCTNGQNFAKTVGATMGAVRLEMHCRERRWFLAIVQRRFSGFRNVDFLSCMQ
jgi:hypothetical protein